MNHLVRVLQLPRKKLDEILYARRAGLGQHFCLCDKGENVLRRDVHAVLEALRVENDFQRH